MKAFSLLVILTWSWYFALSNDTTNIYLGTRLGFLKIYKHEKGFVAQPIFTSTLYFSIVNNKNKFVISGLQRGNANPDFVGTLTIEDGFDSIIIQKIRPIPPYDAYDTIIVVSKVKKIGQWYFYDENFSLKESQKYNNGKPIGSWSYYNDKRKFCVLKFNKDLTFKILEYVDKNDRKTVKNGNGYISGYLPFLELIFDHVVVKNGYINSWAKVVFNSDEYGIFLFNKNKITKQEFFLN